jgi:hypothetical protein
LKYKYKNEIKKNTYGFEITCLVLPCKLEENIKDSLQERFSKLDEQLDKICDRLNNVATLREVEAYKVHNEEMEKITVLLYSLASRLAKTEFDIIDETCLFFKQKTT